MPICSFVIFVYQWAALSFLALWNTYSLLAGQSCLSEVYSLFILWALSFSLCVHRPQWGSCLASWRSWATQVLEEWVWDHEVLACWFWCAALCERKASWLQLSARREREGENINMVTRENLVCLLGVELMAKMSAGLCTKRKDLFLFTHSIQRKPVTWGARIRMQSGGEIVGQFFFPLQNVTKKTF